MIDDINQLLRKQAWVQGMQHNAKAHRAVPDFHVAARVPSQGRNPVAQLDPFSQQRIGNLFGAGIDFAISGADNWPFNGAGHDFTATMIDRGMIHDLIDC